MRKQFNKTLFILSFLFVSVQVNAQTAKANDTIRTLIVFFDGLRPDYITPEAMPRLYAFSKKGCYGKKHHSVYPTVTRVNASSYSTGSYPGTHGMMGNTVYFPQVDRKKGLNTGDANDLNKIATATDHHLLTTISIGEVLQAAGKKMMVFSSGSTGQAMMQNHTISGGAIVNPGLILPEIFKQNVINEIGAIPEHAKPNTKQHHWVADALINYGLTPGGPLVSAIWFSDPDGTAHSDGIGSTTAMQSIKIVDQEFGRILDSIESKKLTDNFNIIVSTDHGFVTNVGKDGLVELLIKQGIKKDKESEDVVVAEGAIYVKDNNADTIRKIVALLQAQDWIGPVFTKGLKPGDVKGWVAGTLSFESIHWNHPDRIADILVDETWDDRINGAGYAGASFSRGVAGHGGLSPYEVHIALLAAGPSFKKSYESELPTSNVDIVPTILHIHKIAVPASMDGRVMKELLTEKNTDAPLTVKKERIKTEVKFAGGKYSLMLERSVLGKYIYVDFAKTIREMKE